MITTQPAVAGQSERPKPFYRHLYFQVLFAIVAGGLIGHFLPDIGQSLKPLGDAFIKLVKMVIAPVIFLTVVTGIAGMRDLDKVGRVAIKALSYFLVFSTLALIVGLIVANVVQPGAGMNIDPATLATEKVTEYAAKAHDQSIVGFLMNIIPSTVVGAFADGEILQVLLISILFGLSLTLVGEAGRPVVDFLDLVAQAFFKLVHIVMKAAPIGAFGAFAFTIGKYGIASIASLALLVGTFYLTSLLFVIVVLGAVAIANGFSIFSLIRYLKAELLLVLGTGGPKEQRQELVVVAVRGKLVAICASESATRDRIVVKLDDLARPLGREEIARAFLGPDAKTMWLEGIHTPTAAKADSKMLSGASLELALDPLGDQSYLLSAVRSRPMIPGLERPAKGKKLASPSTVGSAPGKGRVWVGWPPGWNEFSVQLVAILKHAASGAKSQAPAIYGQLANVVSDLSLAKGAYAVALIPQSLLGEDSTVTPAERETAYRWAHEARFDLTPQTSANVEAAVSLADEYIGKVAITFSTKGEKIVAECRWTDEPSDTASERRQCELYLRDPKSLKVYYNSDHTLSDGALFESGWTDHPFDWEAQSFDGYAVGQEKPKGPVIGKTAKGKDQHGPLIDAIKRMDGTSLFDFVREKLYPTGYLACDDGAMELADFIHFDPASRKLSLIHVKGSGSESPDREVSVSDFEVVVAQAIKNLRHLDRSNVHDALKDGEKHVIAEAVWLNGNLQKDKRAGLLAEIAKPGPITREVVIVQPRLTVDEKRRCEDAPGSARGKRLRQLNALMLAARASALTCGATFKGLMAASAQ